MNRALLSGLAGVVMLAAVAVAPAAEIYVNAASAGGETGAKAAPFRTVQAAISAAKNGDTIRVAAGAYVQNIRVESKNIGLEGGYGSDWSRDIEKNTTTLTGAGGDAVVTILDSEATIDGFRISGGAGSTEELPYSAHGGGIYCRGGEVTISNNTIEENNIRSADPGANVNFGGGIYILDATSATILNNVIRGNLADRGAGIALFGPKALIQGNIIEGNIASGDHGGGLYLAVVNGLVTENIIRGNEVGRELTYGWGGGVIVFNAGNFVELSFNVLYENYAAGYGAAEFVDEGAKADIHHELIYGNVSKDACEVVSAIALDGGADANGAVIGSEATISHCTVVGNICENSTRGNGLQVENRSVAAVTNSIFWDNGGDDFWADGTATLTVTYTDSEEPMTGEGNISADPLFAKPSDADFRLRSNSPCIDAGDPASAFENEPSPNGGRADMGRFGNAGARPNAPKAPKPGDDDDNDNQDSSSGDDADDVNGNANDGGEPGDVAAQPEPGCGALFPAMAPVGLGLALMAVRNSSRRRVRRS